jgi:hypothetical membrane protein
MPALLARLSLLLRGNGVYRKFYLQTAPTQFMAYPKETVAGVIFFVAATQFIISLVVAEALYPGYSVAGNYVSDLGVGPSAAIFNSSVFLLGLLLIAGTYLLRHRADLKTVNILLFLMAAGAIGVGVFTKDFTLAHGAVSSAAFFFSGLSAFAAAKVLHKPFSLISIALGAMTLVALGLFSAGIVASGSLTSTIAYDSSFYLGLGPGGMERMIVYPALMWLAGFGGHLATQREK